VLEIEVDAVSGGATMGKGVFAYVDLEEDYDSGSKRDRSGLEASDGGNRWPAIPSKGSGPAIRW